MCGRYEFTPKNEDLKDYLKAFGEQTENLGLESFYQEEIVPGNRVAVFTGEGLQSMRWSWSLGKKSLINARVEGIEGKPFFRRALLGARCIVPASAWFERDRAGNRWRLSQGMMGLAGLWKWEAEVACFVILTTQAQGKLLSLHHRMPLVMDPKNFREFLDPSRPLVEIKQLLVPYNKDTAMQVQGHEQLCLF